MEISHNEKDIGTDNSGIPTITLKQLRKTLLEIPDEYNDCPVVFSYIHAEEGDNFVMGTIAIKFPIVHPDKSYICLLDGNSAKKFLDWFEQGKIKGKFINTEEKNGNETDNPQQPSE